MKSLYAICPLLILVFFALLLTGCVKQQPAAEGEPAPSLGADGVATAGSKIMSVVYVDQESCCDCTRERQDRTWSNLQAAIGAMKSPPKIEVVHLDTEAESVQLYLDLKPIMVPPGLYFFDGSEVLVEMLQGELSREQIEKVFGQ
jgi:hypothetical protein